MEIHFTPPIRKWPAFYSGYIFETVALVIISRLLSADLDFLLIARYHDMISLVICAVVFGWEFHYCGVIVETMEEK